MPPASHPFVISSARRYPRLRLICLPYAGALPHCYAGWRSKLPDYVELVEVNLPGRGARAGSPSHRRMETLIEELLPPARTLFDLPAILLGHSMGGLIAFELAARLEAVGLVPLHLVVSGCRAPDVPNREEALHDLAADTLIERIGALEGTSLEVLRSRALMDYILPIARADFELVETYRRMSRPPVRCPITALGGASDPKVADEDLRGWVRFTRDSFDLAMFPGGHFFFRDAEADFLKAVLAVFPGVPA